MKTTLDFSAMRVAPSMTLVEILQSYEGAILDHHTEEKMVRQVTDFFRGMERLRLPVPSDNDIRATCLFLICQQPMDRSPCMIEWLTAYQMFNTGYDYETMVKDCPLEYLPIWQHVYGEGAT